MLFSIAWVELKTNSTYRLSYLFGDSLFLLFSQVTYRLLQPYCSNSLVCLVVLFPEIIPKTIRNLHHSFFWSAQQKARHACNLHKRSGYMPWVLEKTGLLILIGWMIKNMSEWLLMVVYSRFIQGLLQLFLLCLVKTYLNEHIIYYNFSLLIKESFWNLSRLLHNLTYLSHLDSFLILSTFYVFLKILNNYSFRRLA